VVSTLPVAVWLGDAIPVGDNQGLNEKPHEKSTPFHSLATTDYSLQLG